MYIYWKPTPDNNDKAECIANDLIRYIIYFLSVYVTNQGGKYFYCIFGKIFETKMNDDFAPTKFSFPSDTPLKKFDDNVWCWLIIRSCFQMMFEILCQIFLNLHRNLCTIYLQEISLEFLKEYTVNLLYSLPFVFTAIKWSQKTWHLSY